MSRAPSDPSPAASHLAKLIDGRAIAREVKDAVRAGVDRLRASGARAPGLAVIMVGDNPASKVYVRNKRAACEECGIHSLAMDLPHSPRLWLCTDLPAEAARLATRSWLP